MPKTTLLTRAAPPVGTMQTYAGGTIPSGWLLCDGSIVSRTTYASLYTAIGDAWGNGDGSTTFHLPDMRGRFPRGIDAGSGNDPDAGSRTAANAGGNTGNNVGSIQGHAIENITGNFYPRVREGSTTGDHTEQTEGAFGRNTTNRTYTRANATSASLAISGVDFDASRVVDASTETRPKNANVNYIIRVE